MNPSLDTDGVIAAYDLDADRRSAQYESLAFENVHAEEFDLPPETPGYRSRCGGWIRARCGAVRRPRPRSRRGEKGIDLQDRLAASAGAHPRQRRGLVDRSADDSAEVSLGLVALILVAHVQAAHRARPAVDAGEPCRQRPRVRARRLLGPAFRLATRFSCRHGRLPAVRGLAVQGSAESDARSLIRESHQGSAAAFCRAFGDHHKRSPDAIMAWWQGPGGTLTSPGDACVSWTRRIRLSRSCRRGSIPRRRTICSMRS